MRLAPPQPSPQRPQTPWLQLPGKPCICTSTLSWHGNTLLGMILPLPCLQALPSFKQDCCLYCFLALPFQLCDWSFLTSLSL